MDAATITRFRRLSNMHNPTHLRAAVMREIGVCKTAFDIGKSVDAVKAWAGDNEELIKRVLSGAALGGATGGAIGATTAEKGNRLKGGLFGGAVGGVVGGTAGAGYDASMKAEQDNPTLQKAFDASESARKRLVDLIKRSQNPKAAEADYKAQLEGKPTPAAPEESPLIPPEAAAAAPEEGEIDAIFRARLADGWMSSPERKKYLADHPEQGDVPEEKDKSAMQALKDFIAERLKFATTAPEAAAPDAVAE